MKNSEIHPLNTVCMQWVLKENMPDMCDLKNKKKECAFAHSGHTKDEWLCDFQPQLFYHIMAGSASKIWDFQIP